MKHDTERFRKICNVIYGPSRSSGLASLIIQSLWPIAADSFDFTKTVARQSNQAWATFQEKVGLLRFKAII